ncbi:MAG TPA: hypothetical protein PKY30_08075 [Myxococcota bacterium]|nr:hypothetical protein [Myxococcota bacterium]HNH46979.1 hypothetical protein [Myxococcota bacterium]
MRLNLGCGSRKMAGWVNVDRYAGCQPDQVVDLEQTPWPWADNSAEEVQMIHVLEHLGQSTERYLAIIGELYRICAPNAKIFIVVPHPRHDSFLTDPTHVRPITAEGLAMFSQTRNRRQQAANCANTPLGLMLGIDLEVEKAELVLDPAWRQRLSRGEVTAAQVNEAVQERYNVVESSHIVLRAVKGSTPAGTPAA